MTEKHMKILSMFLIPFTITVSIFMGCIFRFLILYAEGAYLKKTMNISAGAAIAMMSVIAVYLIVNLLQVIYLNRMRLKSEIRYTSINLQRIARKMEMKNAINKLQDAYIKAEKASKSEIRFVTRMSHDLRTPMNAILGYSMLIERFPKERDKVAHYARRIYVSGQMLQEMINDVLDISCIQNGHLKLMEKDFGLMSALEEVKTAITPLAEAKEQTLRFYITNPSEVDRVTGDKQKLCQIFRNVLSNASKYTPEKGYVEMKVDIADDGEEAQMICDIRDNGCGMSKEFLKVMFKPFEREDSIMESDIQGTGLGLCIARSFTELMDGVLSVESELGTGTLVTVKIPLKVQREDEVNNARAFSGIGVLKGLRFLAAEDNESNAEIIYELLRAMGAECTIALHGKEALEIFENSDPGQYDMILMDIHMPIMNGYQAATAIRDSSHPDAKDIKIIAMTADAFEEDVQRAFVSGMNAHVAKPLDLEAFTYTVASLDLKK